MSKSVERREYQIADSPAGGQFVGNGFRFLWRVLEHESATVAFDEYRPICKTCSLAAASTSQHHAVS